MGFAAAGATASWEQHPGPSGVHRVVRTRRTAGDKMGEWQQRAQAALGHGDDLWCEDECILDYEEGSLEEVELVDDGDEDIWWEQGGIGLSLQLLETEVGLDKNNQNYQALEKQETSRNTQKKKA
ncbi:hypothetical protein NDU88_010384 [Pleurodeles waltl]|uniref:Uncharacterized protein n=1 Tax=Pleurodeles waltl TaxID=8319 RepID=A0AAV7PXW6_PLEWA|nr:hypothetical protein NDU88_010384 [Pleurodeles waltl]